MQNNSSRLSAELDWLGCLFLVVPGGSHSMAHPCRLYGSSLVSPSSPPLERLEAPLPTVTEVSEIGRQIEGDLDRVLDVGHQVSHGRERVLKDGSLPEV